MTGRQHKSPIHGVKIRIRATTLTSATRSEVLSVRESRDNAWILHCKIEPLLPSISRASVRYRRFRRNAISSAITKRPMNCYVMIPTNCHLKYQTRPNDWHTCSTKIHGFPANVHLKRSPQFVIRNAGKNSLSGKPFCSSPSRFSFSVESKGRVGDSSGDGGGGCGKAFVTALPNSTVTFAK